jgi:signal transduction histidine kinase
MLRNFFAKRPWQDWTLLVMHGLFILGLGITIYLWRTEINPEAFPDPKFDDLMIASGIGVALIVILGVSFFNAQLNQATPFIVIAGGWVLTGVYVYIAQPEPLLIATIAGAQGIIGLLYLDAVWGLFHGVGVIGAMIGVAIYAADVSQITTDLFINQYLAPFLQVSVLLTVMGGWIYARSTYDQTQRATLDKAERERDKQMQEMRDRTRVISEMTDTLSNTLNFEKILDATLGIGLLGMRRHTKQRVVSMVLLFRSSNDSLDIVSSRGLNSTDDYKVIHGKQGVIARTLEDCIPIIGKDAGQDPELKSLTAFQNINSILCLPLRAHYDNFGVLVYGSDQHHAFNEDLIDTLSALTVQATVALQNAVLYNSLLREKERIIQMEEDARKALVRDLHDIPTQTMSAVAMRIRIIMRLLERGSADIPKEMEQVEEMALRATEEIRHVLFKLRPLALESKGLTAALYELAEKTLKTHRQPVSVKVGKDVEQYMEESHQGALFYLIEEAISNARKYAEASMIIVQIARQDNMILARISDNGKGFDTGQSKEDGRDHFGLINMRERAELLDGTLSLESVPGKGTRITVHIPIATMEELDPDTTRIRQQLPATKLAANARHSIGEMQRH